MTEEECKAAAASLGSLSPGTQKYGRVTPGRTEDYENGVRNPIQDWKSKCMAAESTYKAAITQSVAAGSYAKGLARSSTVEQQ